MPKFGKRSLELLSQCHPDIVRVCNEVIKKIDFKVLDSTIRTVEQQKQFVKDGKSKTMDSKHLIGEKRDKSDAIDIAPYPIDWKDITRFCYLAGYFLGVAEFLFETGQITSKFRWGYDWNRNNIMIDEKFKDEVHFERI